MLKDKLIFKTLHQVKNILINDRKALLEAPLNDSPAVPTSR
jgi:hypothetical protein